MDNSRVQLVKRLGTAKLLELTKNLTEEERKELLTYVGHLETSEGRLASYIQQLWMSVEKLWPKI